MNTASSPLRYLRHIDVPQIGFAGQEKISVGSVLLVGMGGLGAAAALYLAAAGVKTLGLVDNDTVDLSNLQRQILYREGDVGTLKTEAAARNLAALNGHVAYAIHTMRLDVTNAHALIAPYDVVLDCTDNFAARSLLNQSCLALHKPLVSAAVQGFGGQLAVFKGWRPDAPCSACLFPENPPEGMVPTCPEAGVFGPIVGIMGVMQAGEALKELAGLGAEAPAFLIQLDMLTLQPTRLSFAKNPTCKICGTDKTL